MRLKKLNIANRLGLHARASAKLASTATRFKSTIVLKRGDSVARSESPMELLLLCGSPGTELTIIAEGPDEDDAVVALASLIEDRFGEPE